LLDRFRPAPFAALALLALGGCGLTARPGPTTAAVLSPGRDQPAYDVVEVTAETLPSYLMPPRPGPAPLGANGAAQFGVVPGDVLHVVVYERSDGGLFAPMSAGGTVFTNVRVDESGAVSLPYAGRVRVHGATLSRVEALLRNALAGKAVDPQVHVQLLSSPRQSVLVSGEVRSPGRVTTTEGQLSAFEAVARAGGPTLPAHGVDVVIRNGGTVRRMPYLSLLSQPSLHLARGDHVVVEANVKRFIAMGAVERPGLQDMVSPRMSLLEGLGQAGGLADRSASPRGVFLLRMVPLLNGAERPTVFHLDFRRTEALLLARRFALLPDDTLYVTNAPVWEAQKLITPIIQALILGRSSAALQGG